jgi:hypothetical protein
MQSDAGEAQRSLGYPKQLCCLPEWHLSDFLIYFLPVVLAE